VSVPTVSPSPDSAAASSAPAPPAGLVQQRPELLAAGGFAGGFLFAMILRRFG